METLINIDKGIALFVNNLAGRWWPLDELVRGLANDYFLVVGASLGLLVLWFGSPEPSKRGLNQRLAMQAMASLGLATAAVYFLSEAFFRSRPFDEIAVTTLLYRPTDSSFPANAAAILFGLAFPVWLGNRPAGKVFLVVAGLHSVARVVAGMHYPFDVLAGAAVGGLIALGVRWLFRVLSPVVNLLLRLARAFFLA